LPTGLRPTLEDESDKPLADLGLLAKRPPWQSSHVFLFSLQETRVHHAAWRRGKSARSIEIKFPKPARAAAGEVKGGHQ
jgi:hypothetical protein